MRLSTRWLTVAVSALALVYVHESPASVPSTCLAAATAAYTACATNVANTATTCEENCAGDQTCVTTCEATEKVRASDCTAVFEEAGVACTYPAPPPVK